MKTTRYLFFYCFLYSVLERLQDRFVIKDQYRKFEPGCPEPRRGVTGIGIIKLEVGSVALCKNESQFFTSVLESHLQGFKILPCEQMGMESYFVAEFQIPILHSGRDWPEKTKSLIAINAARSSQIGGVDVDLLLNQARFRTINKAIEAKYFQKFDFAHSRIAIRLENDQLTYHDILASDVFADGLPIVGLKAFGLKPGAP